MKAIDRILWLAYGNAPASAEYREKADIILSNLSRQHFVERPRLMGVVGLDPGSKSDTAKFNNILRPLRGEKGGNPLDLAFVSSFTADGSRYYQLSRDAFDASVRKLRTDIEDLLGQEFENPPEYRKVVDQVMWLAFANHPQTAQHRERASKILDHLLVKGETRKEGLVRVAGLDPGSESDDKTFRRTIQYLRANWKEEEDRKNPLHAANHGFIVSQSMTGKTAYYRLNVADFKALMNVVVKNIRSFVDTSPGQEILELRDQLDIEAG